MKAQIGLLELRRVLAALTPVASSDQVERSRTEISDAICRAMAELTPTPWRLRDGRYVRFWRGTDHLAARVAPAARVWCAQAWTLDWCQIVPAGAGFSPIDRTASAVAASSEEGRALCDAALLKWARKAGYRGPPWPDFVRRSP